MPVFHPGRLPDDLDATSNQHRARVPDPERLQREQFGSGAGDFFQIDVVSTLGSG